METVRRLRAQRATTLILLPLVAGAPGTIARWAPDAGECVEWHWRVESRQSLQEVELILEPGQPPLRGIGADDAWLDVRDVLEVTARDVLLERDDRDLLRLQRELVRARRATTTDWRLFSTSDSDDAIETVSPLEGARLEFRWHPAAAEPKAEFAHDADEIADEALLEGLDEGLDLRGLLGGVPRAPGDTWQLEEDALLRWVRPGGELALAAPEPDFEGEHDTAAFGWLLGAASIGAAGDAWGRAEYERVTRDDGRRVARIALRATIECRGSVREALDRLVDTLGSGRIWLDYTKSIEVEHALRLEGVLLWDLDARRAHRLELDGRSETRLELGLDLWDLDWKYVVGLRGDSHLSVGASVVE